MGNLVTLIKVESQNAFRSNLSQTFELAMSSLMALGFRIDRNAELTIHLIGAGMSSNPPESSFRHDADLLCRQWSTARNGGGSWRLFSNVTIRVPLFAGACRV